MAVVIAADHLAVFRPRDERDGRAMDADKALAVIANERQQVGLLRVVHVEIAVGEKHHGVKGIQVLGAPFQRLLGDVRAVGPEKGVPPPRASPQVIERRHGGGDRIVLIALALADEEQVPLPGRFLRDAPRRSCSRIKSSVRMCRVNLISASRRQRPFRRSAFTFRWLAPARRRSARA